jgi:hypothetical protein
VHTCDMRRSKTYILSEFPQFVIENDFTEADELWLAEARETMDEMTNRVRSVLDMIFNKDSETCQRRTSLYDMYPFLKVDLLFRYFYHRALGNHKRVSCGSRSYYWL